ncbi:dihydrofolate reductase-like protein [Calycina marina]|uniref:Dihydrofolate reductase-like protein n=1 Tax=Calycina marina TaxID=1763456 RepID=A0A9P8CFH9_9HELO|nr:dihydrofolate reductase-like protein [Calycina marina]
MFSLPRLPSLQVSFKFPYLPSLRRLYHTAGSPILDTMTKGTPIPDGNAKKLKILMLHGYTQSGPLFHDKTRSLEKLLIKSLKPVVPTFTYPTAPIRLVPADIPGFDREKAETDNLDAWGWWKRETGGDKYIGLEQGLDSIAQAIKEVDGIDAVIGFSQGAAAAMMVASLLQPSRSSFFPAPSEARFGFPPSWNRLPALHPNGLKFAVSYSGFMTPNAMYKGFYEPKISCRTLHFIGSLDSVVEESRCLALMGACEEAMATKVVHPGGHFVPVGKEMGGLLVGFVRESIKQEEDEKEKSVEDMDVPF